MDGESENPGQRSDRCLDLSGKVLSFGYLFFAPAKKSNSRVSAKAFDLRRVFSTICHLREQQEQGRFALTREFISFAGPKETNQRKGPSPTHLNSDREAGRDFRTRHPWLDPKTAGILPAALRVWLGDRLLAKAAKAANAKASVGMLARGAR